MPTPSTALSFRSLTSRVPGAALVFALAASFAVSGCDRQSEDKAQPAASDAIAASAPGARALNGVLDISHRGSAMPSAVFKDPAGKVLNFASLKGAPVLVNLWATWCGPCVIEMAQLDALAGTKAGKLRVVTVSQDLAAPEKVAAFFAAKSFAHLEPWLDPDNALSDFYATGTLPTTVLYDAQGNEVWRMIGGHDWAGARTEAMLADTLADKPAGGA